MVRFTGASVKQADSGERQYSPRGPIYIRASKIVGFYDHTLLVGDHQIRVMETIEEIHRRLQDDGELR